MKQRTALIAGATGLVGGECLRALLASELYSKIIVLARRPLASDANHATVRQVVVDFAKLDQFAAELAADHVFCALGTTIRKAGSKARFREVDFDYPRRVAALTLANGATHFSLVSSLGANSRSGVFYSRVKGELEDAVRAMDWPSLCLLRPSVIAGNREESRPMERISETLLRFGPAAYRPVPAEAIARAMLATARRESRGLVIIESSEIPAAARS